ncbi:MAG: hypothetical protein HY340_02890 [Candidatus Kerfeldbacteria bacterium]|nr:hypothetical protein [Candidatus Kerfeldbacteria bacterium]
MPERLLTPETSPTPAPAPEKRGAPERFAVPRESADQATKEQMAPSVPSLPTVATAAPPAIQRLLKEVEGILSDGLDDAYGSMDALTQKEFKEEGERAAEQIRSLLEQTKVKVRNIIKILTRWLTMIPGVSRLFVEQEAKIKTDRLLSLHRIRSSDDAGSAEKGGERST